MTMLGETAWAGRATSTNDVTKSTSAAKARSQRHRAGEDEDEATDDVIAFLPLLAPRFHVEPCD
jgi:hypothetical protein